MGNFQVIREVPRMSKFGKITNALAQGYKAYQSGQDRRMAQDKNSLADALTMAKVQELQAKTEGLNAPVPSTDYFRDPASGKLFPKDPYRGRGTTVNLPFQFDASQKDDSGDVFNSPDEADAAGLPAGSVVQVINPATGEPEDYEV